MNHGKKSWGFPKWGDYGQERDAVRVRTCDYHGCQEKADHPAPKSPGSPEKWWFCQHHAAEYNKNWNYFEGMSDEEARRYAHEDAGTGAGFRQSDIYGWGGSRDDSGFTPAERAAFDALEMEPDSNFDIIKRQYRKMVKKYHPDTNKGCREARQRFEEVSVAFDALKVSFAARPGQ